MDIEMWIVVGLVALLCGSMLVRPQLLAFWAIHRTPAALAATRGVGALGLVAITILLLRRWLG